MRWLQTEYILKGVFLGLVFYAALCQADAPLDQAAWIKFAWFNLSILGGLLAALVVSAVVKLRQGFRARGKPHVFFLFLLLESPWLIYVGMLAGALFGLYRIHDPAKGWDDPLLLPVVGGASCLP